MVIVLLPPVINQPIPLIPSWKFPLVRRGRHSPRSFHCRSGCWTGWRPAWTSSFLLPLQSWWSGFWEGRGGEGRGGEGRGGEGGKQQ